ncbi:hypothetical protein TanjilG_10431 [Lupinus angustifolius]|uniref:Protein root UVB sensitive/RUS domain-containing protein n=1 Tax=Lupinus angustifolius TaxID=3871 RepID=A0A4P1R4U8_LUPAN|nr:hypothetical protein TanjilG_10431 [Lupinus angustifolius]
MPLFSLLHTPTWNFQWGTHPLPKQSIPINQNLFLRRVLLFSLKTPNPFHCVSSSNDGGGRVEEKGSKTLPFVVKGPTNVSRYLWDGEGLKIVTVGDGADDVPSSDNGFCRFFCTIVRDFFIPRHVRNDYLEFVKWKLLHRVFSSALQVLATQAMFTAIGVGFSSSLPSAAALNWVSKDGLGRLSRCIYTASLASAFDTNLKRVRFCTSVIFVASIGLELLTPTFPRYFLLLATIANIAKQISLACYLATRSFAIIDNLGEISAKAQDRLEIILNTWIECGYVPSPAEVSEKEGIDILGVKGKNSWPIRIGCLNSKNQIPKWSMKTIQFVTDEDYYFVCMEIFKGLKRTRQACYIRRTLLENNSKCEFSIEEINCSRSALSDWSEILEDSKKFAEGDLSNLIDKMVEMGWVVKSILLSTQEQVRYSFVCD